MSAPADLFAAAAAARANAYAPYSKYKVGAALRTVGGHIFAGANVENAAYPVGTCAEAGAIAAMVAAGEKRIAELLVIGEGPRPPTPCGACRQRIAEFASADCLVHAADPGEVRAVFELGSLLPEAFALDPGKPKAD